MAGMGPPPKPFGQRRRRNLPLGGISETRLPAAGRRGHSPPWPIPKHPNPNAAMAEAKFWGQVWRKPQAVMWEQMECFEVVARYVRLHVESMRGYAGTDTLSEVRQLEDRLGLSPMSMLRLRWRIDEEEIEGQVERPDGKVVDIRERLRAVETSS